MDLRRERKHSLKFREMEEVQEHLKFWEMEEVQEEDRKREHKERNSAGEKAAKHSGSKKVKRFVHNCNKHSAHVHSINISRVCLGSRALHMHISNSHVHVCLGSVPQTFQKWL